MNNRAVVGIVNPRVFSMVFEIMKSFTDKVTIFLTKGGLKCSALNDTRVVLFHLLLSKSLVRYIQTPNKDLSIGVDLPLFLKGLKGIKDRDHLTLHVNPSEDKKFTMVIKKRSSTFTYQLNEFFILEEEEFEIPSVEYCCEALIETKQFAEIIGNLSGISDYIEIGIENNPEKKKWEIFFQSSNDVSNGKVTLEKQDSDVTIHKERPVKHSFSTQYLSLLAKTCKIGDILLLQLPYNANPLTIIYRLGKRNRNEGNLKYFIAPYVDENESDEDEDKEDEDSMDIDGQ